MVLSILIVEDRPARQEVLRRLCKDHAWVMAHTARRALTLLGVYDFDLIFLDYDLAGEGKGEEVAAFLARGAAPPQVIVHAMNAPGAARLKELLPRAVIVPFSKITRNNATFKRLREELGRGPDIDWSLIFRRERSEQGPG